MENVTINQEQGLYVIRTGNGYTCLGFDAAFDKTRAVALWLRRPDLNPPDERGTVEAWAAYKRAMAEGAAHHKATGQRCGHNLDKRLAGYVGRRVEVIEPCGGKRRFWVGRSAGWMPLYLEIARRDSIDGPAAFVSEGATIRLVG